MSPFEKWLVCIGGFKVSPRSVLPLGKEGEQVLQVQRGEGGAGAVRRIIIESAAEF